jgi:hypothetical protein
MRLILLILIMVLRTAAPILSAPCKYLRPSGNRTATLNRGKCKPLPHAANLPTRNRVPVVTPALALPVAHASGTCQWNPRLGMDAYITLRWWWRWPRDPFRVSSVSRQTRFLVGHQHVTECGRMVCLMSSYAVSSYVIRLKVGLFQIWIIR